MHTITDASPDEYEHVTMSGDEATASDELAKVELKKIDAEIEQVMAKERVKLEIFDGAYLRVSRKPVRGKSTEYRVHLAFLDPTPVKRRESGDFTLAGMTGLLAVATLGLAYSPWVGALPVLPTVGFLAALALAGLAAGIYRSMTRLGFLTRNGHAHVFDMSSAKPNRKAAAKFMDVLVSTVGKAQAERMDERAHYRRDEMKEHRRLHEDGVLSPEAYEDAKTRILAAHD